MDEIIYKNVVMYDTENHQRRVSSIVLNHCESLLINLKSIENITFDVRTIPLIYDNSSFMVIESATNPDSNDIFDILGSFGGFDIKMDTSLWYDVNNNNEYQFIITCKDGYTKHIIINRDIQKMRERSIDELSK